MNKLENKNHIFPKCPKTTQTLKYTYDIQRFDRHLKASSGKLCHTAWKLEQNFLKFKSSRSLKVKAFKA